MTLFVGAMCGMLRDPIFGLIIFACGSTAVIFGALASLKLLNYLNVDLSRQAVEQAWEKTRKWKSFWKSKSKRNPSVARAEDA